MKKDSVEIQKALNVVFALKNAGVLFVPLPIINTADKNKLLDDLERRLQLIEGKTTIVR